MAGREVPPGRRTYLRYATRAEKLVLKLDTARDRELLAMDIVAVTILDKSTGDFTLTLEFPDRTRMNLEDEEVLNGDVFEYDIHALYLTNTAQAGITIKLIVERQVL